MATSAKPANDKTKAEKPVKAAAKKAAPVPAKSAVEKKTVAKKAAVKVPAGKKMAAKAAQAKGPVPSITAEQRRFYVEVAAYYIAERRGFSGGGEFNDWVEAEAEIDRLLQEGILKP